MKSRPASKSKHTASPCAFPSLFLAVFLASALPHPSSHPPFFVPSLFLPTLLLPSFVETFSMPRSRGSGLPEVGAGQRWEGGVPVVQERLTLAVRTDEGCLLLSPPHPPHPSPPSADLSTQRRAGTKAPHTHTPRPPTNSTAWEPGELA